MLVREQSEQVAPAMPSMPSPWDRTDGWTNTGRRSSLPKDQRDTSKPVLHQGYAQLALVVLAYLPILIE